MEELLKREGSKPVNTDVESTKRAQSSPFAVRNFRLLWSGETISLMGDQFYMLALSWLIIQLTGSGIAVGTILMAGGIPRVLFMLVGGAMTDRLSPRTLMIISNAVRGVLTLILTLLVLTSTVQLWMLYVLAVAFGTADAFFHPAYMAIVPAIVDPEQLEASNAIVQGSGLITQAIGPGIAGLLVSIPIVGTVIAFAFDTLTFFVTTGTLSMMHGTGISQATQAKSQPHSNILSDIAEGFRSVGRDPVLPPLLVIIAVINFMFTGPMSVGPTKLAQVRFVEGVQALGWIGSAFGIGALVGMVLGGVVKPKKFGLLSLMVIGISGLCLAIIGLSQQLWVATLASAAMGATVGVCQRALHYLDATARRSRNDGPHHEHGHAGLARTRTHFKRTGRIACRSECDRYVCWRWCVANAYCRCLGTQSASAQYPELAVSG